MTTITHDIPMAISYSFELSQISEEKFKADFAEKFKSSITMSSNKKVAFMDSGRAFVIGECSKDEFNTGYSEIMDSYVVIQKYIHDYIRDNDTHKEIMNCYSKLKDECETNASAGTEK